MIVKKISKFDGIEKDIDIEQALDELEGNYYGTRKELREMLIDIGILQTPTSYYTVTK